MRMWHEDGVMGGGIRVRRPGSGWGKRVLGALITMGAGHNFGCKGFVVHEIVLLDNCYGANGGHLRVYI